MNKSRLILNIFLLLSFSIFAQKPPENDSEFERQYKRNIQKDYLHGIYIPKDLADAFNVSLQAMSIRIGNLNLFW